MIKKKIGNNMTEVCSDDGNFIILISYSTAVAAYDYDSDLFYVTLKKYSMTTFKHIRKWLSRHKAHDPEGRIIKVDPSFFSELMQDQDLRYY